MQIVVGVGKGGGDMVLKYPRKELHEAGVSLWMFVCQHVVIFVYVLYCIIKRLFFFTKKSPS